MPPACVTGEVGHDVLRQRPAERAELRGGKAMADGRVHVDR